MILYLTEPGYSLSVSSGHYIIKGSDHAVIKEVPVKLVDGIITYSDCSISSGATCEALREGTPLLYLTPGGQPLGKVISFGNINVERQRKQILLAEMPSVCLAMSRKTIAAKIHNQVVYGRRLLRTEEYKQVEERIIALSQIESKIEKARSLNEIEGFEGLAARHYFQILSAYLPDEFKLERRVKHPATDPTNALLSMAYSLLHSEIYAAIEAEGLHPYFGFMHQIKRGHAALASDLIEEYRSIIPDPLVVNFINHSGITSRDFIQYEGEVGCFLSRDARKSFLREYEKKMQQPNQYIGTAQSFRQTIAAQVQHLAICIEHEDMTKYQPLKMR